MQTQENTHRRTVNTQNLQRLTAQWCIMRPSYTLFTHALGSCLGAVVPVFHNLCLLPAEVSRKETRADEENLLMEKLLVELWAARWLERPPTDRGATCPINVWSSSAVTADVLFKKMT